MIEVNQNRLKWIEVVQNRLKWIKAYLCVDNVLCLHEHKLAIVNLHGEVKTQRSLFSATGTTRMIKLCW